MAKELNMVLHCGGQEASWDDVVGVGIPEAARATETYTPLRHDDFVNRVKKLMTLSEVTVKQERFALAKDGNRMFGLMELEMPSCPTLGFSNVLGIRNSLDKSFPAGVVIGSQVFVCDNLAFSGEIKAFHRHTKNLFEGLDGKILGMVGKLAGRFTEQNERFKAYQEKSLSRDRAASLIFELARNGVVNATDMLPLDNEFRNPSHEEFEGETAWGFFNATTEILKGRVKGNKDEVVYRPNLWDLPRKTETLHRLIDVECGFEPIVVTE